MKRRTGAIRLRTAAMTAIGIAVVLIVMLGRSDSAVAKSNFLGDFNALYGTAGTPLDTCSVCHSSIPALNPYGSDWKDAEKSFTGVEALDSDGDGFSNIEEIDARRLPGDPTSHPTPPPTTQPPPTTTTEPPPSTQPPPTTLPPPAPGPIEFDIRSFDVPASVDVGGGDVPIEIDVAARVSNVTPGAYVTATFKLYANGVPGQTLHSTRRAEDSGRVDHGVKLNFTMTTAHVPEVEWWLTVTVDDQTSAPEVRTTTVRGPGPTTTTPPTTTRPPTTTTTTAGPPTTTRPAGPADGAAVYAASCAGCHGADGAGGFGGPVAGTTMSLSAVEAITRNGEGSMPGFAGQLTAEEINAVAAYVVTLGDAGAPSSTTTTKAPPGAAPASGAKLYRQHCSGCHGPRADGGAGGPLVTTSLSVSQQITVTTHGRGTMPGFKTVLTAAEISAIVRYVAGLGGGNPTTTAALPGEESGAAIYDRLCASCHGADGSGGPGGPIAGTGFNGSALADVITSGIGTMPAVGSRLDATELSRLVAHVEGWSGANSGTEAAQGPGAPRGAGPAGSAAGPSPQSSDAAPATSEAMAAGGQEPASLLPIGNPVGWMMGLAIVAALMIVGSTVTGAMPLEVDKTGGRVTGVPNDSRRF